MPERIIINAAEKLKLKLSNQNYLKLAPFEKIYMNQECNAHKYL